MAVAGTMQAAAVLCCAAWGWRLEVSTGLYARQNRGSLDVAGVGSRLDPEHSERKGPGF